MTTPLTILFYPVAYRQRLAHDKVGCATISSAGPSAGPGSLNPAFRYAVVLQQFEHLPAVFAFCKLIKAPVRFADAPHSPSSSDEKSEEHLSPLPPVESPVPASALTVSALRLVELSERTSAIISASDPLDKLVASDSLSQAFRAFAHGSGIPATASISIVGSDQFPDAVATHVEEFSSDLVVLPWALHGPKAEPGVVAKFLPNPFEGIFRGAGGDEGAPQYASFARRVFAEGEFFLSLFSLFFQQLTNSTQPPAKSGFFSIAASMPSSKEKPTSSSPSTADPMTGRVSTSSSSSRAATHA